MITVNIPSPLRSYTGNQSTVEASGGNLREVLLYVEENYQGILFRILDEQGRIRQHIKFYVNKDPVDDLDVPLRNGDTLHIICALSGG